MSYSITIPGGPVSEFGERADAALAAAPITYELRDTATHGIAAAKEIIASGVPDGQHATARQGIAAAKAVVASGVFDADGALGVISVSGHGHTEGTAQTSFSFNGYQVETPPA